MEDEQQKIEEALKLLKKHIGCYGRRITEVISIEFSNGVILRENGFMMAGGIGNVAKAIAAMEADER